ncbi:MAG: hypothetical protein JSW39_19665 [Desulfobacterales bacterium]|nr:MAG: hypothetical protein JSW39_19665 [Desulfobacterales bacterium]
MTKNCFLTTLFISSIFSSVILLNGCESFLAFSTATKFGLDISQRADQTLDIVLGYQRLEVASIPIQNRSDTGSLEASETNDAYSVIGTFSVKYGNPFRDEPLVINQFFATGMAARKAALNPEMRRYFGESAGVIRKKGEGELK